MTHYKSDKITTSCQPVPPAFKFKVKDVTHYKSDKITTWRRPVPPAFRFKVKDVTHYRSDKITAWCQPVPPAFRPRRRPGWNFAVLIGEEVPAMINMSSCIIKTNMFNHIFFLDCNLRRIRQTFSTVQS